MTLAAETSYDRVPYADISFPEAHPRRLHALATLYGLAAPPIESARILELGCAGGWNTLMVASSLPDATFVGIDFAARQIEAARKTAAAAGIGNVEFRLQSILDVGPDFGRFDYIICHGVFSWVPADVQQAILRVCRENLNPQGLAYISYNILPGWYMHRWLRDMMIHASEGKGVADIKRAREFIALAGQSPGLNGHLRNWIGNQSRKMLHKDDSHLLHEYLEEYNDQIYFKDFMHQSSAQGLQYVGDARTNSTFLEDFGSAPQQLTAPFAGDRMAIEQSSDFLRCRSFRRSILCHAGRAPDLAGAVARIKNMCVYSPMRLELPASAKTGGAPRFRAPNGACVDSGQPAIQSVLTYLQQVGPQAAPFPQLHEHSCAVGGLSSAQSLEWEDALAQMLFAWWRLEMIELHSAPLPFAATAGDRPEVTSLVRYQAQQGPQVSNFRYETVNFDPASRLVIAWLDGSRTRADLVKLAAGDRRLVKTSGDYKSRRGGLEGSIGNLLVTLAQNALLVR